MTSAGVRERNPIKFKYRSKRGPTNISVEKMAFSNNKKYRIPKSIKIQIQIQIKKSIKNILVQRKWPSQEIKENKFKYRSNRALGSEFKNRSKKILVQKKNGLPKNNKKYPNSNIDQKYNTTITTTAGGKGGSEKLDSSNQPRHTQGQEKRRPST